MAKLNKVDELVVSTLENSKEGMMLAEIAEKSGESSKKIFKSLRKLFENEIIDVENRRYRLTKH
jgi:predicted transcriptional regulator